MSDLNKPKEYKSPLIEELLNEVTPEELERVDKEMSKKQTAVEWLINKHFGDIENLTPDFKNHIKQALQMEKEQIIEACSVGYKDGIFYANGEQWEFETSEQYYEQTYGK